MIIRISAVALLRGDLIQAFLDAFRLEESPLIAGLVLQERRGVLVAQRRRRLQGLQTGGARGCYRQ